MSDDRVQVSLIEMADEATVVCQRTAADQALLSYLKARMYTRACSHGNYLPSLDAALELMKEDAGRSNQLFLVFLSDGAPSDHTEMACKHGVQVWQPDPNGGLHRNGRPALRKCPWSNACRQVHCGVGQGTGREAGALRVWGGCRAGGRCTHASKVGGGLVGRGHGASSVCPCGYYVAVTACPRYPAYGLSK